MAQTKHSLTFLLHSSCGDDGTPDKSPLLMTSAMRRLHLKGTFKICRAKKPTKRAPWSMVLKALVVYKQIHGNLLVPQQFDVPRGDDRWPRAAWGLRLGIRVHNLRTNTAMDASTRRDLDAMGFEWRANRRSFSFDVKLAALKAFKATFGHVRVPQKFALPDANVAWAGEDLPLGSIVNKLRRSKDTMPPHELVALDNLGFAWSAADAYFISLIKKWK